SHRLCPPSSTYIRHLPSSPTRLSSDLSSRPAGGVQPAAGGGDVDGVEVAGVEVVRCSPASLPPPQPARAAASAVIVSAHAMMRRSEEHTSELPSLAHLVLRLLPSQNK